LVNSKGLFFNALDTGLAKVMEGLKIGRGHMWGRGASNNRRTFDGTYLDSNSVENQWGVGGGQFSHLPIGSNGPDALDTKWADFDVEKVNELLE